MRLFLLKSQSLNLFQSYWAKEDSQASSAAQHFLDEHFKDSFELSHTPGFIDEVSLQVLIDESFKDEDLTNILIKEIEKIESTEASEYETISKETLMRALSIMMRNKIKMNDAENEEIEEDLIEE